MAYQKVQKTKMTHKDGKPRKRLVRERLYQNGKKINLRRLSNRRRLVVRR